MKRLSIRTGVFLVINALLLLVCLVHLPSVFQRPRAPFIPVEKPDGILVETILDSSACGSLKSGDKLVTWGGLPVRLPEAVEFLGDLSSINSPVSITFERNNSLENTHIRLVPYYPTLRYLVIIIFVGFVIWGVSIFILLHGPPALATSVLHWTLAAFAVTILITLGAVSPGTVVSLVERFLFLLAYTGVVALFFFFTLVYPKPRSSRVALMAGGVFVPALILVAAMSYFHLSDLWSGSMEHFGSFQLVFDVFQGSLFVYMGGGILNILHSYRKAVSSEERKRLQWIIWGTAIGSAPFLFFHVLPQILFSRYVISEEYATVFFLVIAFSYAISLVRYRFLDIEVLINRSIVYSILTVLLLAMHLLVVLLFAPMLGERAAFDEYVVVVAGTLFFIFLLNPVRVRLQRVIDEALFTARVNFRKAVQSITGDLHRSLSVEELYRGLLIGLSKQIPVAALAIYRSDSGFLVLKGDPGTKVPDHIEIPERLKKDIVSSPLQAVKEAVMIQKAGIDFSAGDWLRENGISVCSPLVDEKGGLKSVVTLSMRAPGERFREEELDLVTTVCAQASEILGRVLLQERAILEREERKRMQEISDLKSYFVSSVSHELRMPLTSIRMFAESLRHHKRLPARTRRDYLEIIEGESERLSRLIGNVLDFSGIERGVKEYHKMVLDPREPVKRALKAMTYEFKKEKASVNIRMRGKFPMVLADQDAFEEVVLNLLSNALKYSLGKKRVAISMTSKARGVVLEVSDRGMGMQREELGKVFDKFHRVRDPRSLQVGGTGLGLAVVKHFVEAHSGTIVVESKVGKGSTFRITLPASDENDSRRRR